MRKEAEHAAHQLLHGLVALGATTLGEGEDTGLDCCHGAWLLLVTVRRSSKSRKEQQTAVRQ